MYNSPIPTAAELPSSRQLLRSTVIAAVTAAVLLVTVVIPAEYGRDPTGVGRLLGLTQMGEIKTQLAAEAEFDRAMPAKPAVATAPPAAAVMRTDDVSITLKPNQSIELKLTMNKGAQATYAWNVEGGTVTHDTHGERHGSTTAHSYKKGSNVIADRGVLIAAFDGIHGWYWRNRGDTPVTIEIATAGFYKDLYQPAGQ
jgi:hypothetical protein